jgi:hypothetical protein
MYLELLLPDFKTRSFRPEPEGRRQEAAGPSYWEVWGGVTWLS